MEDSGYRKSMILIAVLLVLMLITPAATHASAEPIGEDGQATEEMESASADESSDDTSFADDDQGADVQYSENESTEGAIDEDESIEEVDAIGEPIQVSNEVSSIDISNATVDPIPEQYIHDYGCWSDRNYHWNMWEEDDVSSLVPSWKSSYSSACPRPHVQYGDVELKSGVDYTVTYYNCSEVGVGEVTIIGKGRYTGRKTVEYVISLDPDYDLSNASVESIPVQLLHRRRYGQYESTSAPGFREFTYTKPDIVVRINGVALEPGNDYRCTQTVPDGAGTAKVTITGNGEYTGSIEATYQVRLDPAYDLSRATVTNVPSVGYSDDEITVDGFTVKLNGVELKGEDISFDYSPDFDSYIHDSFFYGTCDFFYAYDSSPDPGVHQITIVGCGDYYGKKVVNYKVISSLNSKYGRRCYTSRSVYVDKYKYKMSDVLYTGKPITPKPIVEWHDPEYTSNTDSHSDRAIRLKLGTDYTLSYKNNTKVGTATITVTGKGCYKGTFSKTFKIVYPISKASISKIPNATYAGKAIKPKPTVKALGKTLKLGTDYTLSYKNNSRGGKATVTIRGTGAYKGSVSKTFKIYVPMKRVKVAKIAAQVPLSKTIKPKPIVRIGSHKLRQGTDYIVSYKNNTKAGLATIIIKGKGYYRGTKKVTFTILPKGYGKTITLAEYNLIKNGMTYREVVCLVGGNGREYYSFDDGSSTRLGIEWVGSRSYSYADIVFEDGRVVKKYQYGL